MPPTRAQLRASAEALCSAFASKSSADALLAHFSTTHQISATEHGLPLLPFLGRTFTRRTGLNSVSEYFGLLVKYLTFEDMLFEQYIVDEEACKVSVTARAKFTWVEGLGEGQAWDEQFIYLLDFDQDAKVTDYQVWADSGAAYLARRGELSDRMKEYQAQSS